MRVKRIVGLPMSDNLFYSQTKISRYLEIACSLVIILCALAWGYGDTIGPTKSCLAFQDSAYIFHPVMKHIGAVIRGNELPLWINTVGGGIPLYGNPLNSPHYPIYNLFSFLFSSLESSIYASNYFYIAHTILMVCSVFVLAWTLGLSLVPATIATSLFVTSAEIASLRFWLQYVVDFSLMPLAFSGAVLIGRLHFVGGLTLLVLSLSLMIFAYPAQPLIITAYGLVGIASYYVIAQIRSNRTCYLFSTLATFVSVFIVTLAITSPYLVSLLQYMSDGIRFVGNGSILGDQNIPLHAMTEGQYSPKDLFTMLLPIQVPHILGDAYLGAPWFVLCCIGVFLVGEKPLINALVAVSIYCVLSSLGDHTPLFFLNTSLPFLNMIREPTHFLILSTLSLALLGAYVVQRMMNADISNFSILTILAGGVALEILTLGIFTDVRLLGEDGYSAIDVIYITVFFCSLLLLASFVSKKFKVIPITVLALFCIKVSTNFPNGCNEIQQADLYSVKNQRSLSILKDVAAIEHIQDYRVLFFFSESQLNSQFWSMNASTYDIRSLEGYFNPLPAVQFASVWQGRNNLNYSLMLGARYILCDDCSIAERGGYVLNRSWGDISLWENSNARGYFSVANEIAGYYKSREEFLEQLTPALPSPKAVYLPLSNEGTPYPLTLANELYIPHSIHEISRTYNLRKISVRVSTPSLLIMNEYFRDDWRARVDGVITPITSVNLNQVAVPLSHGSHIVEFEYWPQQFLMLRLVSNTVMIMFVLFILVCIYAHFYRQRGCTRSL
jgi:hypothetical protein